MEVIVDEVEAGAEVAVNIGELAAEVEAWAVHENVDMACRGRDHDLDPVRNIWGGDQDPILDHHPAHALDPFHPVDVDDPGASAETAAALAGVVDVLTVHARELFRARASTIA